MLSSFHKQEPNKFLACCLLLALLTWPAGAAATTTPASLHTSRIRFRLSLDARSQLDLLRPYRDPSIETPSAAWRFMWGPWGWNHATPDKAHPALRLVPDLDAPWVHAQPLAPRWGIWADRRPLPASWGPSEASPSPWPGSALFGSAASQVMLPPLALLSFDDGRRDEPTCAARPVRFTRYRGETDAFALLSCDGSIAPDAIDRLSILARPPGVELPTLPLPVRPSEDAADGEWLPSVRMMHPRLVWLVQQLADAFPHHGIYIVSGYRPGQGVHGQGRALDLQVLGVANERLYHACRRFRDVGCGFYPNHDFVHVDVRPAGTGSRTWVDDSSPGEPSRYVEGWPGLEGVGGP